MDTEGNGVTRVDGLGWGGDRNTPTTQEIKDSDANGSNDGMARELRTAALRPRGTTEDDDSMGPMLRKYDSANGARSKNGMRLRRN